MPEIKKIHIGFVDDDKYVIDIFKASAVSIFKSHSVKADTKLFTNPTIDIN